MTRPIYEPSLQRTDARLGYGSNQLFRRPAPTTGGGDFPIVFRAAVQSVADPENDRVHYPSGDGGDNVYWDYWDTTFDTTVFDIGPYDFTDPLTGRLMIAGVGLLQPGLYSIHAQIDLGQYLNGVVLFNSNYDEGQAVYSEHVNVAPGADLFLGDFYGIRLDHWRMVTNSDIDGGDDGHAMGGESTTVEIVFAQQNDTGIVFYSDADVGTQPLAGGAVTPNQDCWIPGGYGGAWGLVPKLIVMYWGQPSSGWDSDWPDTDLF